MAILNDCYDTVLFRLNINTTISIVMSSTSMYNVYTMTIVLLFKIHDCFDFIMDFVSTITFFLLFGKPR